MGSKNRNVWIFVAVIVVALCCCTLALAAAGVGWLATQPPGWTRSTDLQSERSEETYSVGEAPSLQIDNFAGRVIVRSGESGTVRVAATRKARSSADLGRIQVAVSERDGGLVIKTEKPWRLGNASVNLEITAPASTRLDVHTSAGTVDIEGITGGIQVQSGAGDLDVRGAAGIARLETDAGSIRYQGAPQGDCRFETRAGNITLALPTDLNVQIDLETSVGGIDVDLNVDGQVSRRSVQGVIGSGTEGSIHARTGAGNIDVVRR